MRCREFDRRFHQALDRRQRPEQDRRLVRHARRCARCRALLDGWAAVEQALGPEHGPLPSAGLAERVLADPALRPQPLQRPYQLAGLAATLLLCAIGGLWYLWQHGSVREPERQQARATASVAAQTAPLPRALGQHGSGQTRAPSLTTSDDPAASAELQQLQQWFAGQVAENIALPTLPDLLSASQQIESADIPGIGPLAASLSRAITLLRQAMPADQTDQGEPPQAGLDRIGLSAQLS